MSAWGTPGREPLHVFVSVVVPDMAKKGVLEHFCHKVLQMLVCPRLLQDAFLCPNSLGELHDNFCFEAKRLEDSCSLLVTDLVCWHALASNHGVEGIADVDKKSCCRVAHGLLDREEGPGDVVDEISAKPR